MMKQQVVIIIGFFCVLLLVDCSGSSTSPEGQEEQVDQVHPALTECGAYGCYLNWFCLSTRDYCVQCPNNNNNNNNNQNDGDTTDEDDCRNMFRMITNEAHNNDKSGAVFPSSSSSSSSAKTNHSEHYYTYTNSTEHQMDLQSCFISCIKPQVGDFCSDETGGGCDPGRSFCNYYEEEKEEESPFPTTSSSSSSMPVHQPNKEGICQPCRQDIRECLNDPTIRSPFGVEECILCDIGVCSPMHYSTVTRTTTAAIAPANAGDDNITQPQPPHIESTAFQGSPKAIVKGPLVNCNNLIFPQEVTCGGSGEEEEEVDGQICLVHDTTRNTYYADLVTKCAALGGIGVVVFQENHRVPNNETWTGHLSYVTTTIPSVVVPYDVGIQWEQSLKEQSTPNDDIVVQVNVTDVGTVCIQKQFCNDDIPCVGSSAGQFCDYKWGNPNGSSGGGIDDNGNGFCRECPTHPDTGEPDPLQCFFDIHRDDQQGSMMSQSGVESCSKTCASTLEFPKCKFCPDNVDGFNFGRPKPNQKDDDDDDTDEKCRFCPNNDVLYPDKEFPLFGDGVKCWMVQKFFDSVHVNANAKNCQLAQMMNYVCGCSGSGYLGANTQPKQLALVWLPRIMALLSIVGSTFIIWDASKSSEQRQKVMNQLLILLSLFDLMGSTAYAFTTLPIPKYHPFGPIVGAEGTETTCTVQGWFIQMGTISAYMNVSLAIYYLLVIKYRWDETSVQKIRWILFAFPILVGFGFAMAGIPYYDSLNLWCNNTASYWPDIPVAVAIGVATIIMSLVCYDVYSKERAAAKWRGGVSFIKQQQQQQQQQQQSGAEQPESRGSLLSRISAASLRSSLTLRRRSSDATITGDGGRQTLSQRVFWQSFFYLMAFYLTWPPYLALQNAWAGGSSFTNYGFALTAATLVPLQGFWNMLVYIRPRYMHNPLERIRKRRSGTRTKTTQTKEGGSRWSWLSPSKRSKDMLMASTDDVMPVFTRTSIRSPEQKANTPDKTDSTSHHLDQEEASVHRGDQGEEEKQEEEPSNAT